MMRLSITIDAISHQIDSTDPDLLGRWVMEIFGRAVAGGMNEATHIQVQVWPSWVPGDMPGGRPDWVTDPRITGHAFKIRSPRELVAALSAQLDEDEELT